MLLLLPLLAGLLSPISPAEAKRVLDITEKNFGQRCGVGTKTLALVLFYSPAGTASPAAGVEGLPHSSTPITFYGEVTEEALVKFLRGAFACRVPVKAGLTRSGESLYGGASLETATDDGGAADEGDSANPWTTGATVVVNASSYASVILDNETNAMLALYTPECGEPCARLRENCRRLPARGPPRGVRPARTYGGDVDLHEIVGFINDMTGSHRQPDGKLEPGAGRRPSGPTLVLGRNLQQLSEEVAQAASDLPHSKRYVSSISAAVTPANEGLPIDRVLERENAAIDQLLNGGSGGGIAAGAGQQDEQAERDEGAQSCTISSPGVVDIIVDHLQGERQSAEAAAVAEKRRLMEEQQKAASRGGRVGCQNRTKRPPRLWNIERAPAERQGDQQRFDPPEGTFELSAASPKSPTTWADVEGPLQTTSSQVYIGRLGQQADVRAGIRCVAENDSAGGFVQPVHEVDDGARSVGQVVHGRVGVRATPHAGSCCPHGHLGQASEVAAGHRSRTAASLSGRQLSLAGSSELVATVRAIAWVDGADFGAGANYADEDAQVPVAARPRPAGWRSSSTPSGRWPADHSAKPANRERQAEAGASGPPC
uniref:Nicastrin n=1 Tax=Macrostomum lignano TaxID=282301 RepID=A0A1I8F5F1_9PLAT